MNAVAAPETAHTHQPTGTNITTPHDFEDDCRHCHLRDQWCCDPWETPHDHHDHHDGTEGADHD